MNDATTEPAAMPPDARLPALRAALAAAGLDGFLVPRSDEHLGENVPAHAERLAWLTGFTGSAGIAIVLADRAAIFSDGRYTLQLEREVRDPAFSRFHISETPPHEWLRAQAGDGPLRIGIDPRVISERDLERFRAPSITLVPLDHNPVDRLWTDRPLPPSAPAQAHPERWAGRAAEAKIDEIAAALRAAGEDAAVVTDPASIAWLLNIRGADLPNTPVVLGFALVRADGQVELFTDPAKFAPGLRASLGNRVSIAPVGAMDASLGRLAGKRVRVDRDNSPASFGIALGAAGAETVSGADPCLVPKSRKNAAEQEGMREAHRRDGVALVRFLHWLEGRAGQETEISAAHRLLAFRADDPSFRGESFPAISAAGEHGAIMHYHPTEASDRPIQADELYLIDSGGQYEMGTTDVTRTVWTGPGPVPDAIRDQFTRVLKGHVALAAAAFPQGVTGHRLDALARAALWQVGLDYDHGTGHGVGSVLSVHEGPISISAVYRPQPFETGMVVSNEPGFYLPGSHGIRLENLLLVVEAAFEGTARPFLRFETLTLAPFDRRCIEAALLTPDERAWIDAYHARVLAELGPALADPAARDWLAGSCRPL